MSTTAPTESELKAASSDLWQINDAIDKLDKLEAVIAEFATRRARAPEVDFPPSEISSMSSTLSMLCLHISFSML